MDTIDLTPFYLSFKLAIIVTIILFFISLPLSYYLANSKTKLASFIDSIINIPLILPPTVLGFYLLVLFAKFDIAFSFLALILASIIYIFNSDCFAPRLIFRDNIDFIHNFIMTE